MNKRLEAIYDQIEKGKGIIDVGTDHGYLPAALAEKGYKGRIIASDIHAGPLAAARRTAESSGVEDKIQFLLCDGLEDCDPGAVDTIVIAGMGGDTICGILDRAEWCMTPDYTLILQPMTKAEVVRYWLAYNGYEFLMEELVKDGGTIYQILKARIRENTRLSNGELFTGKFSLIRDNAFFPEYLQGLISRFEAGIKGLEEAKNAEPYKLSLRKSILSELLVMKEELNDKNSGRL